MSKRKEISVSEAGRRGGRATLENHGTDFFKKIGRKGGHKTAKLYANLLSDFGKLGGRPKRPNLDITLGEKDRKRKGGNAVG